MISIPFTLIEKKAVSRTSQPMSVSFPFVKGAFFSGTMLVIKCENSQLLSCQISPLTFWHDGSIKWAIIDFIVDIISNETLKLTLTNTFLKEELPTAKQGIKLSESFNQLEIDTGVSSFKVNKAQGGLLSVFSSEFSQSNPLSIQLSNTNNDLYKAVVDSVFIEHEEVSHRKKLTFNGSFINENKIKSDLLFESTLTFFANKTYTKMEFTLHNPQAAMHPGGLWDLGDENSVNFQSLSVNIPLERNTSVNLYDHISNNKLICEKNIFLKQFSSGGVNWNSPVHKGADGNIDIEKNGFVIKSDDEEHKGMRISPTFSVISTKANTSVYVEKFWQNFPKSIEKEANTLQVALFPKGSFELQGGEKKSHSIWIDLKSSHQKFDWVDKPLTVIIDPKYIELTGAFDFFNVTSNQDVITKIIEKGISGDNNFFEKREAVDEYGWRNFGDLYADHETQGYSGEDIFVSHYNNQYDPIYGLTYQFLVSGNSNYFVLANDLTNHVVDIDIYHTDNDKDEYNGGLFWHTDHYLDASTSTHRTFSKNHKAAYEGYTSGGGPGGQHCYTTGLKSHYLLTGDEKAKNSVLQLANWITYSFEGSNSFLAKLFAIKQSGSRGIKDHLLELYPLDRGTGHYVVALLDAYDLTQNKNYQERAFNVISHTIHPNDDISQRSFDNIEATWFYTVFLQSVGRFLHVKEKEGELDDDFYYARDAMLHYANWMVKNELPYLEQVDKLEFPNTTWAGQDLRKVGVFYMAYYYSTVKDERFLEKAEYFYKHLSNTLKNDNNHDYTRILVLLMQNVGFANYYKNNSSKNTFESIKDYSEPVRINKKIKACKLLIKELTRLSIKNELQWLSLRSAKVAKLLGKRS